MKISKITRIAVCLLVMLFFAEIFTAAYCIFLNGGYSGFDLGKNNQSIWLLSHLRYPFNTIMGMNTFGDHMHIVLLFLTPFYIFWQSPACLLFINILFRAIGIYIVYLLAKKLLNNNMLALLFAILIAFNPEYINASLDHFYPEELASPLIFIAFYMMLKENYTLMFISLFLIASVKEDAPAIAFMITTYFLILKLIESYKIKTYNKKLIFFTIIFLAFLIAYFLISIKTIAYLSNNNKGFSDNRVFGPLSTNLFNINYYTFQLSSPDTKKYIDDILGPFGYMPLLSPDILILCAPSLVFNILTPWPYARNILFHYSVYITPILLLSVMHIFKRIIYIGKKLKIEKISYVTMLILSIFLLNSTIIHNLSSSKIPISDYTTNVRKNLEFYNNNIERNEFETAANMIPPYANVSADVFLVTRLTSRPYVYQFTNPWRNLYWGNPGADTPADEKTIQYIIIKYNILNNQDSMLIDTLINNREYKVIYRGENNEILLLERIK